MILQGSGIVKQIVHLFNFLTTSTADCKSIWVSLGPPKSSKNELRELGKRIRSRFWVPRCLQDPILEHKLPPKTCSRLHFGHQTSLQNSFKTLFWSPKYCSSKPYSLHQLKERGRRNCVSTLNIYIYIYIYIHIYIYMHCTWHTFNFCLAERHASRDREREIAAFSLAELKLFFGGRPRRSASRHRTRDRETAAFP